MKIISFPQKQKPEVLTNGELWALEKRIDEISEIIDLCGDSDQDVIDALDAELSEIQRTIKTSLALALKHERKVSNP